MMRWDKSTSRCDNKDLNNSFRNNTRPSKRINKRDISLLYQFS